MAVIVTGGAGQVGRALNGPGYTAFSHAKLDVTEPALMREMFATFKPDAVVHCAAWTDVDGCQTDPVRAHMINAVGTQNVVDAAAEVGAYVVFLSTDYVFAGDKADPYVETDAPGPKSVYGMSKYAGEVALQHGGAVVRSSWINGAHGHNLVRAILDAKGPLRFVTDQRAHPTIASDLAAKIEWFVSERPTGIWHVTNQGAVSAFEFAQCVLEAAGDDPGRVEPITSAELDRPAARPENSVLANARLTEAGEPLLPDFRESLPALVAQLR